RARFTCRIASMRHDRALEQIPVAARSGTRFRTRNREQIHPSVSRSRSDREIAGRFRPNGICSGKSGATPMSNIATAIVSPRPAWRGLPWLVPLTVLWIVLIYWQPIIPTSGVPTSAHQLAVHGLIAVGLWLGLGRTDRTPDQRLATWLAVMIPYTLWF